MTRIFTVILLSILCVSSVNVKAQNDNDSLPPYLQFPLLPEFNLLTLDSQQVFNTKDIPSGRKIMLIMFSPDCHHCEELAAKLVENCEKLQHVRIYMTTPMSLKMTNEFYEKTQLANCNNIIVTKDFEFFFPSYYRAYEVPFVAVYSRGKRFLEAFDQSKSFEEIMSVLKL